MVLLGHGGYLYRRQIDRRQDRFISMLEPVEETLKLPLSATVMEKYLWGNGVRLLKQGKNSA